MFGWFKRAKEAPKPLSDTDRRARARNLIYPLMLHEKQRGTLFRDGVEGAMIEAMLQAGESRESLMAAAIRIRDAYMLSPCICGNWH